MERVSGWKMFAGIMLMIVGFLNAFDGLVAITQANYIRRNTGGVLPITNNVKTWGWVALIIGVIIGPRIERQLRTALAVAGGDVSTLWSEPLAVAIYVIIAVLLLWPLITRLVRRPGRRPSFKDA